MRYKFRSDAITGCPDSTCAFAREVFEQPAEHPLVKAAYITELTQRATRESIASR